MRTGPIPLGFLTLFVAACGARTDTIDLDRDAGTARDSGVIITRDGGVDLDGGTRDGGPRDGGEFPRDAGEAPDRHRPEAVACDMTRPSPPVVPNPNSMDECAAHTDCTAGMNGRCLEMRFGYVCTYDECFSDDDCSGVCECNGGFGSDANVCLRQGDCNVDADCGAGNFCSPSFGDCGSFSGTIGYFCHTPQDDCVNDSDCTSMGPQWYCRYDPLVARWSCSDAQCAG